MWISSLLVHSVDLRRLDETLVIHAADNAAVALAEAQQWRLTDVVVLPATTALGASA